MIGNDLLLFSDRNLITSVERLVNGFPDKPPISVLFSDSKPSREMVVLVAITPAILVSFMMSIMSSNCSSVKSGAIFRRYLY